MTILRSRFSFICFIFFSFFSFSTLLYAKEVSLYDQPNTNAKVVGKIDIMSGVVPIFTNPDGAWMKVGDPKNGNVGWIKSSDISDGTGPTSFTFTQKIVNDSKGTPQSYQVIQYGKEPPKDSQQYIQSMIQNIMKDFNNLYEQQKKIMSETAGPMPIIVPVLVMPPNNTTGKPQNTPAPQTTSAPSTNQR